MMTSPAPATSGPLYRREREAERDYIPTYPVGYTPRDLQSKPLTHPKTTHRRQGGVLELTHEKAKEYRRRNAEKSVAKTEATKRFSKATEEARKGRFDLHHIKQVDPDSRAQRMLALLRKSRTGLTAADMAGKLGIPHENISGTLSYYRSKKWIVSEWVKVDGLRRRMYWATERYEEAHK